MIDTVDILGVKVSNVNLDLACENIERWIINREKRYVCVAPVSTVVDCQNDNEYRNIINHSGMTTPDGMPLVWIGKMKGSKIINRTYGPDLMPAFFKLSERKNYSHYFYGGTSESNEILVKNLHQRFPKLKIVGQYAPPFRGTGKMEDQAVLDEINRLDPDCLWIGLGSPKQDYWMAQHRNKINVPVMIGVGAAFDFLAGTKKQAPRWMQKCGLEWLFRLLSEPKRLWKRYVFGNSRFVFLLIKSYFKNKFIKAS